MTSKHTSATAAAVVSRDAVALALQLETDGGGYVRAAQSFFLPGHLGPTEAALWGDRYFERQENSNRCGKHALNNMLAAPT